MQRPLISVVSRHSAPLAFRLAVGLALFALTLTAHSLAPAPPASTPANVPTCARLQFEGQVAEIGSSSTPQLAHAQVGPSSEWSHDIGAGWRVRLLPIPSSPTRLPPYSGWDIVIEPASAPGYPDALLLATPPYGSPSQREIATTFGMRAQDAIAWSPRQFRFLTSTPALLRSRALFAQLSSNPPGQRRIETQAQARLLAELQDSSRGTLEILDATLTPGTANPPSFAAPWAARLSHIPQTVLNGTPSARGRLRSIRFRLTLWVPSAWQPRLPKIGCAQ